MSVSLCYKWQQDVKKVLDFLVKVWYNIFMKKVLDNFDPYVLLEERKKKAKAYLKTEKGKDSTKKTQLKRHYNLSLEDYKKKLKEQNHKCAICGIDEADLSRALHVDHDHDTKEVRGLLCVSCNVGLGHFKDDSNLLSEAISYLQKYK